MFVCSLGLEEGSISCMNQKTPDLRATCPQSHMVLFCGQSNIRLNAIFFGTFGECKLNFTGRRCEINKKRQQHGRLYMWPASSPPSETFFSKVQKSHFLGAMSLIAR